MATVSSVKSDRFQFQALFDTVYCIKITAEDVASLLDAAGSTESFTVPGLTLGDHVISAAWGVDLAGMTVTWYVSAANTLKARVQNESASTVDLASATVTVLVGRPAANLFA